MDASGKDGTIRQVFTGVNPQGCRVVAFKQPDGNELAHDYLWRVHAVCPSRGELGIFNRSHYEDVIAVRVRALAPDHVWRRRFDAHPRLRAHARRGGNDRAQGLPARLARGAGPAARGAARQPGEALEAAALRPRGPPPLRRVPGGLRGGDLAETSTAWAPWYVVPADHNWVRNLSRRRARSSRRSGAPSPLPTPDPRSTSSTTRRVGARPRRSPPRRQPPSPSSADPPPRKGDAAALSSAQP